MLYINNTTADTRQFHAAIVTAIANGGILPDELIDVFTLTRTPPGSAADWRLDWA